VDQTVKPERTAAIILGASYWPEYPSFGKSLNPVFGNSAAAMREYLTDPMRFGLLPARVLNLFESQAPAPEIHQLIAKFLTPLCSEGDSGGVTDLIVYYVGHGGFTGPDRRYFFAIPSTVEGYEGSSGLRAADLASTLKTAARRVRKYLILDCCFAAAAFTEFQSAGGVAQLAGEQFAEELPAKGTALLCAASKSAPAIAPVKGTYTMFSGALREVLLNGSKSGRLHISLYEIGKEIKGLLREWSPDDWVRPQVLSPDAAEGDVAEVALFPNPAVSTVELRHLISGLMDRVADIEKSAQAAVRMTGEVEQQGQLVTRRVGVLETQAQAVDGRVGELLAASQKAGQHLSNLERQGQTIARRVEELEAAAKKMASTDKLVHGPAEGVPALEKTPVESPQPTAPEVSHPKLVAEQILNPLAAIHISWVLAFLFFWFAIPNLDFLEGRFGQFQIGSVLNGRKDYRERAYQFGVGDFTSSLVLFTLSVVVLPFVLSFVFRRARWRNAFLFALCWAFACMTGLFCAHFVGKVNGGDLAFDDGFAKWLFWGTAAAFVYGLVQGGFFSFLGVCYRVISRRGAIAICASLAFSSTVTWVLCLMGLWQSPRLGFLALVSSAVSAIILANLHNAVEGVLPTRPKSTAPAKLSGMRASK